MCVCISVLVNEAVLVNLCGAFVFVQICRSTRKLHICFQQLQVGRGLLPVFVSVTPFSWLN